MAEIEKTDREWKEQLSEEEYEVTRKGGTERAFTGRYWDHYEPGTYRCVGCGVRLFPAETKYDSGSGWPSFYAPLGEDRIEEVEDRSMGMVRTEVRCARCKAHLGHLFTDGPAPTGKRYCLNSASLTFEREDGDDDDEIEPIAGKENPLV